MAKPSILTSFLGRPTTSLRRRLRVEQLEDRVVPAITPSGVPDWVAQGPGPILGGQTTGIADSPVTGSVHALAAHPNDANILFAGGSNGGVWRTLDSTAANPLWTPLTDTFHSLSIGALEFDPSNPNVLLVGIGGYASGGFDALGSADGDRTGALITTNALAANPVFRQLGGEIEGQDASGVAARAGYLLVAGTNGLYRSTDNGDSFQQLFGGFLPSGGFFDLIGDPGNPNRFYVANSVGVYRCDDMTLLTPTWVNVSDPLLRIGVDIDGDGSSDTTNVEFAIHNSPGNNVLYVGTINSGRLAAVTSSTDQGSTWTAMDTPLILGVRQVPINFASNLGPITITSTPNHGLSNNDRVRVSGANGNTAANGDWTVTIVSPTQFSLNGSTGNGTYTNGGIWQEIVGTSPSDHPGSQGRVHFSIVASPTNPNLVFVGGDRQERNTTVPRWPNSIGADDFTGSLWRGDRSVAPGGPGAVPSPQWTALTDDFAGGGSSPHADSREMVFDANGDLVESDDGGVYRRDDPTSTAGAWTSVNGNLAVSEFWTISLDTVNNVLIGGFQDTGTAQQSAGGNPSWNQVTKGDGFFTAVDNTSVANQSVRYTLGNTFFSFERHVFDSANAEVGAGTNVMLADAATPNVQASGLSFADQNAPASLNPIALNATDARLMLIGRRGVYEDNDPTGTAGDLIVDITPAGFAGQARALAYGGFRAGVAYAEIAWVGTQTGNLYIRGEGAAAFTLRNTGGAGQISAIALDPDNWQHAYVLQGNRVWETPDGGVTFNDITANLGLLSTEIRTLALWDANAGSTSGGVIPVVGGRGGVYRRLDNPLCPDQTWSEYGVTLPNTIVEDLKVYGDTLVAGTYGRGAWTVPNVAPTISGPAELIITGDGAANAMDLRIDPNDPYRIQVSDGLGNTRSFDKGVFRTVRFQGLGGADTITIDSNGAAAGGNLDFVTFAVEADGGGNAGDTLILFDGDEMGGTFLTLTDSTVTDAALNNFFGDCGTLSHAGFASGGIVITTGSAGDTVTVDAFTGLGSLDSGLGSDTILSNKNENATLNTSSLTSSDGMNLSLFSIETANLTGGASANTFAVQSWVGIANLSGLAGNDIFNLGSAGSSLGSISGTIRFFGDANDANPTSSLTCGATTNTLPVGDTVNFNDQGAAGQTYTLGATTFDRTGNPQVQFSGIETVVLNAGSTANTITVTATGASTTTVVNGGAAIDTITVQATGAASNLTVSAGGGNDAITVRATGAGSIAELDGGTGNDTFAVGSAADSLAGILGTLCIDGGTNLAAPTSSLTCGAVTNTLAVGDSVTFNDQGATGQTYTLGATTLARTGNPMINFFGVETVTLNAGTTANTITVTATGASTTTVVNGGAAIDTITVLGIGAASNLTVNAAGGADSITLRTTAAGGITHLNGGAGDDMVTLGNAANSLDGLLGNICVEGDGQTAADKFLVNDQGDADANTYTLTGTSLTRSGIPVILYGTVETMMLNGGSGTNSYVVTATGATAGTEVNDGAGSSRFAIRGDGLIGSNSFRGNGGNDAFTVDVTAAITGTALTISGGAGTDSLAVNGTDGSDTVTLNLLTAAGTGVAGGLGTAAGYDTLENFAFDGRAGINTFAWIDSTGGTYGTAIDPTTGLIYRPTGAASGEISAASLFPFVRFANVNGDFTANGDSDASGDRDVLTVLGASTAGQQSAGPWRELTSADGRDDISVSDAGVTIANNALGALRSVLLATTGGGVTFNTLLVRAGNESAPFGDFVTATPSNKLNILLDGMDPKTGKPGDRLIVNTVGPRAIVKSNDPTRGPAHVRIVQTDDGASVGFWHFESVDGTGLAVSGTGPGVAAEVQAFDAVSGVLRFPAIHPFGGFAGGVTLASGDVNGDGIDDIIVGAGPGGGPHVKVYDGIDGAEIRSFFAFDSGFQGGIFVAAGDLNGDGAADIIVGAGAGADPRVSVFDGQTTALLFSFDAYDPGFTGGVRVAAGDVNGDGVVDIITAAGAGGGPHVRVFDGRDLSELLSFFAYDPDYAGGVFLSVGDVNGDSFADIITGTGNGSVPHVRIWDVRNGVELASFLVNDPFSPDAISQVPIESGISVSAVDLDGDGVEDILTGKGLGTRAYFRGFRIARYDRALKQATPLPLEQILLKRAYEDTYGFGISVG